MSSVIKRCCYGNEMHSPVIGNVPIHARYNITQNYISILYKELTKRETVNNWCRVYYLDEPVWGWGLCCQYWILIWHLINCTIIWGSCVTMNWCRVCGVNIWTVHAFSHNSFSLVWHYQSIIPDLTTSLFLGYLWIIIAGCFSFNSNFGSSFWNGCGVRLVLPTLPEPRWCCPLLYNPSGRYIPIPQGDIFH